MATKKSSTLPAENESEVVTKPAIKEKPVSCGLVMPISAMDGCSAEHWSEVKSIVTEAVEIIPDFKFTVRLVSDADDVGVIQKRIVQNVYSSDIIVCDVSGKNPNVMFELGLRLAFDKPTIIIKDDKTDYTFDTGIIEHIGYPRDLRFNRIVAFKSALAEKVLATYRIATKDPNHSTFLKNFGKFHVAGLSEDIVPADKLVFEMLQDMQLELARIRRGSVREPIRRGATDKLSSIANALASYRAENSTCVLEELIGNSIFIQEMEKIADAPRYFQRPTEFRAAVDEMVRQAIKLEERRE